MFFRGVTALTMACLIAAGSATAESTQAPPNHPDQATPLLHRDCPGGRPVTIAVLQARDNLEAAAAVEGALAAWDCVNVVTMGSGEAPSSDTDVNNIQRAANNDVDWLVIVHGTSSLMNARLIDPNLSEVLALSNGPVDEVVMDLLAPVSREMALAAKGGGRLVLSLLGVNFTELKLLENLLRRSNDVTDVDVARFSHGSARLVVRTTVAREALLSRLGTLSVPGKSTAVTGVTWRRVELSFAVDAAKP